MHKLEHTIRLLQHTLAAWTEEAHDPSSAMTSRDVVWLQRRVDRLVKLRDETIPETCDAALEELNGRLRAW